MASITPVELSTLTFSGQADRVLAQGTLATAVSALASGAIVNSGPTNTRGRADEIVAVVEGSETPDTDGFLVGIVNTDTLQMRGGADLIEADMTYSGTAANMEVIGILGHGAHGFNTGGGSDDIIASVNASSTGTIIGTAIKEASIETRNGSDYVSGETVISDAGENSRAYGILDSVIDTSGTSSNDDDVIRAVATITGQSNVAAEGLSTSTLSTGAGDDQIIASASATITADTFSTARAFGINLAPGFGGGPIDTGDGDDLVSGTAIATDLGTVPNSFIAAVATGIFGRAPFINLNQGTISTGAGNDTVIGISEMSSLRNQIGRGIDGVIVDTGTGNDSVTGKVQNITGGGIGALSQSRIGLNDSNISTGSGNDTVTAELSAGLIAPGTGAIGNTGIRNTQITTDAGSDRVEAKATYTVSDNGAFLFTGVSASSIATGTEDDVIAVTSSGTLTGAGGRSNVIGIRDSTLSAGDGNDTVKVSIDISAGDNGDISVSGLLEGSFETTTVDLGEGNNSLDVRVTLDAGTSSFNSSIQAVIGGTVIGGSGADIVDAHVVATAGTGTDLSGADAISSADLSLGGGADILRASTTLNGTGLAGANGNGIRSTTIDMGAGNDQIIAAGANQSFPGSGTVNSFGIANSTVSLGDGDDIVTTTGTDGGVSGSQFFGGLGDDTFNFGSGVASTIDGGAGADILGLDGVLADYAFTALSPTDIRIEDIATSGATTSLTVTGVESVRIDTVLHDIDTLIV